MNIFAALTALFSRRQPTKASPMKILPKSGKSRLVVGGALTAAGVALASLTTNWEGVRNDAYLDRIASTPVWTVCAGETKNVKKGDRHSDAECRQMLVERYANDFEPAMRACLKSPDSIPDGAYIAFADVSYNIGSRAFCGSSMARLANAGDLIGACNALLRWNKAGGRVVKGLDNRRKAERQICLGSLR